MLRTVFCSGVTHCVIVKSNKSGCLDGGQMYSIPMKELTVAIEIVPGLKELDGKLLAKSLS